MKTHRGKRKCLRLEVVAHKTLRQRVLRRDGWRCQSCGAMTNLEVHHQEFKSHGGEDSEENLITLCFACHRARHGVPQCAQYSTIGAKSS